MKRWIGLAAALGLWACEAEDRDSDTGGGGDDSEPADTEVTDDTDTAPADDTDTQAADTDTDAADNQAPTAVIHVPAAPWGVPGGASVALDGAGSSDPEGAPLRYAWTQIAGPEVGLSDATAARPSFTAPDERATLRFSLVVNDGSLDSTPATVVVEVLVAGEGFVEVWDNPLYWLAMPEPVSLAVVGERVIGVGWPDVLVWVDVSAPVRPVELDRLRLPEAVGGRLGVDGERAVVVNGATVLVFDLSGERLVQVGTWTDAAATTALVDVALAGDLAVVTRWNHNDEPDIHLLDLSDPTAPRELSRLDASGSLQVTIRGHQAYVTADAGLRVFDLTDPTAPSPDGAWLPGGGSGNRPTGLAVAGDHAYISYGVGLYAVRTGGVANPALVWSDPNGGGLGAVAVDGARLYVAGSRGLDVYSLAAPAAPVWLEHTQVHGEQSTALAIAGDHAFVGERGLQVVDTRRHAARLIDVLLPTADRAMAVDADGALLVVAEGSAGASVWDVSGAAPARLASAAAFRSTEGVALAGGRLALADTYEVWLYDLANPAQPVLLGSHEPPAQSSLRVHSAAWAGASLYVGDANNGLHVYDGLGPGAPSYQRAVELGGSRRGVDALARAGGRLVASTPDGELLTFDLTDPTQPVQLGAAPLLGDPASERAGLTLIGDDAWAAAGTHLVRFDLTDPSRPLAAEALPAWEAWRGVDVDDGVVWAADGEAGLLALDPAGPRGPRLLGRVDSPGAAWGVRAHAGRVWAPMAADGVLGLGQPTWPTLRPAVAEARFGETLRYTLAWTSLDPAHPPELTCVVVGGRCVVEGVDPAAQSATLAWTLPEALGRFELAATVGDYDWFMAAYTEVEVTP